MTARLGRELAAVTGRRISKKTVYSRLVKTRCQLCDSRRVFIWSSLSSLLRNKIDRFVGKGTLVCDGIMVVSRTSLYVFDASTVYTPIYWDEILEAHVRFFWVLWVRTTFVWTKMLRPHGTHIVDEFHEVDISCMDLNPTEHIWDGLGKAIS
ncbi:hypothetical protein TNCV_801701 [Trichonephila clavipes]|nr:hypothetical protein TNCV_801701 [Trichonephila clavipes]